MNVVEVARHLDRVRLKDGSDVGMRPLEAADREAITALYDRLSQHSRYQRFFACPARLPTSWADILLDLAPERRFGLVAEVLSEPVVSPLSAIALSHPSARGPRLDCSWRRLARAWPWPRALRAAHRRGREPRRAGLRRLRALEQPTRDPGGRSIRYRSRSQGGSGYREGRLHEVAGNRDARGQPERVK
jgi:hypothetical protein